jgi:hypothetical protein
MNYRLANIIARYWPAPADLSEEDLNGYHDVHRKYAELAAHYEDTMPPELATNAIRSMTAPGAWRNWAALNDDDVERQEAPPLVGVRSPMERK